MHARTIVSNRFGAHAVLVDDVDAHVLEGSTWALQFCKSGRVGSVMRYAPDGRHADGRSKYRLVILHRELLGLKKGDKLVVDHQDGNPLNNLRKNLRLVTKGENAKNRTKGRCRTDLPQSGYPGVYFVRKAATHCWVACININKVKTELGQFKTVDEAIAVRKLAERKHYGEFSFSSRLLVSTN